MLKKFLKKMINFRCNNDCDLWDKFAGEYHLQKNEKK